jgi:hypothetical protein
MLAAETAILVQFQFVRGILLVFRGIVVSLFALVASQCDLYTHFGASLSGNSLPALI